MNDYISGCEKLLTKKNYLKLMNDIMKKFMIGKNINWYSKLRGTVLNLLNDIKY